MNMNIIGFIECQITKKINNLNCTMHGTSSNKYDSLKIVATESMDIYVIVV